MRTIGVVLLVALGCGGSEGGWSVPKCAGIPDGAPGLTAAPTFSSARIGPGEPLTVRLPVNSRVRVAQVTLYPAYGSRFEASFTEVREEDGLVEVSIEDTDLPDDLYVVGEIRLGTRVDYRGLEPRVDGAVTRYGADPWDPDAPFYRREPEEYVASCVTEFGQPSMEVVSRMPAEGSGDTTPGSHGEGHGINQRQ